MKGSIFAELHFKKIVTNGIFFLGVRKLLIQVTLTTSNIVIARILTPKDFGSFAIISFIVITFGVLTGFGLNPALIQRKFLVTKRQLRAIFTFKVLAALIFSIIMFIFVPFFLKGPQSFWLRIYSFYLVLLNAYGVSSALLERKLEYKKLALGDIITVVLTQSIILILAIKGFGVGSFVLGSLISAFLAFFVYFYLRPWPIGLNFSFKRNLRGFWNFGLNHFANSVIGSVNGAVVPFFVGAVSGAQAVGFVNWAGGIRQGGLAPFEVIEKIIFPGASRIQRDRRILKKFLEKIIRMSCMFSFPILATIFVLARPTIVTLYTSKWLEALTALQLSLIQAPFLIIGSIMMDTLFALGEARLVRNISLFWTTLQWLLTIPLVIFWNFNGVVLAGVLVSSTFFIPMLKLREKIDFDVFSNTLPYLCYSIITGIFVQGLSNGIPVYSLKGLVSVSLLGFIFYSLLILIFERSRFIKDITAFAGIILKKE